MTMNWMLVRAVALALGSSIGISLAVIFHLNLNTKAFHFTWGIPIIVGCGVTGFIVDVWG